MKKKKRKSFYNNKNRNQKWTEELTGRPISFADKYDHPEANDNLNNASVKRRTAQIQSEKKKKQTNRFIAIIACIAIVCVGYTGMQVHIDRHQTPLNNMGSYQQSEDGNMAGVSLEIKSLKVESIGLDASVMLSSVITQVEELGYTSVTFDAKRSDGSIGYNSKLASVDTYNAVSAPAADLEGSVKQLLSSDILPVARICCYRDNLVPSVTTDTTIMTEKGVYKDSDGNTYLNPDSSITYNYLKDIVTECYESGITVFVLYGCDLPDEISADYQDGFDALVKKLNADLENNVRFYEAVDLEITDANAKAPENTTEDYTEKDTTQGDNDPSDTTDVTDSQETEASTEVTTDPFLAGKGEIGTDQVYYVKSEADINDTVDILSRNGITSYILED